MKNLKEVYIMYHKILSNAGIFCFGAVGYTLIEILYRGYTHWTMALTGGLCLLLLYHIYAGMPDVSLLRKSFIGTGVITAIEFAVGCIVNLYLKWNIWDYSGMYMDILGQICLFYSFMWFLLSGFIAVMVKVIGKVIDAKKTVG